jgi:hypothetical protein
MPPTDPAEQARCVNELGRFCTVALLARESLQRRVQDKATTALIRAITTSWTKATDLRNRLMTDPLFHAEPGPLPTD